jgi:hypothetical protein
MGACDQLVDFTIIPSVFPVGLTLGHSLCDGELLFQTSAMQIAAEDEAIF